MRVLVTGGSGRVGRWVQRELIEHGHEVVSADRRALDLDALGDDWSAVSAARYVQVDLADLGQVLEAIRGCDAVVHLGAIPVPVGYPPEVVFRTNVETTYTVLQAAEFAGVERAVIASSLAILGITFAPQVFPPLYAPVDEQHPLLVEDTYALTKELDERTAAMFQRRTGMDVLAFRFHVVTNPGESAAMATRLAADPTIAPHLFWGYVDVRDVAQACRLGVEKGGLGFEVFNVVAADTLHQEPTEDLIRRHFPQVELREAIPGTRTAFSIEKAQRLLGYAPRYTWRDA